MSAHTNTGDAPLILPSNREKPIGPGETGSVTDEDMKNPTVKSWVESGVLKKAKGSK